MGGTRFSHLEINVGDYRRSILFYDKVLRPLGWERLVCTQDFTAYCDGHLKLILCPVSSEHQKDGFHRKRIGLNHIALSVSSREEVDRFYREILQAQGIPTLYQEGPAGDDEYYSILFEDPDRMKIEVVFAPHYCDPNRWPNTLPSDFVP